MICKKCGNELPPGAVFCNKCGERIAAGSDGMNPFFRNSSATAFNSEGTPENSKTKDIIIAVIAAVAVIFLAILLLNHLNDNTSDEGYNSYLMAEDNDRAEDDSFEESDFVQAKSGSNTITAESVSMSELISLTASSTLKADKYNYEPENLVDGDRMTAWVEGVADCGMGEYVEFVFDQEVSFTGMNIRNGYQKNDDIFCKNTRVKTLRIEGDQQQFFYVDLQDSNGNQNIRFDASFTSKTIRIYIEDVYRGNKYEDTCISEISFY